MQADDRAAYKPFDGPEELTELVADDLAVLLTERFTRPVRAGAAGAAPARLPVPPTAIVGRDGARRPRSRGCSPTRPCGW